MAGMCRRQLHRADTSHALPCNMLTTLRHSHVKFDSTKSRNAVCADVDARQWAQTPTVNDSRLLCRKGQPYLIRCGGSLKSVLSAETVKPCGNFDAVPSLWVLRNGVCHSHKLLRCWRVERLRYDAVDSPFPVPWFWPLPVSLYVSPACPASLYPDIVPSLYLDIARFEVTLKRGLGGHTLPHTLTLSHSCIHVSALRLPCIPVSAPSFPCIPCTPSLTHISPPPPFRLWNS